MRDITLLGKGCNVAFRPEWERIAPMGLIDTKPKI